MISMLIIRMQLTKLGDQKSFPEAFRSTEDQKQRPSTRSHERELNGRLMRARVTWCQVRVITSPVLQSMIPNDIAPLESYHGLINSLNDE